VKDAGNPRVGIDPQKLESFFSKTVLIFRKKMCEIMVIKTRKNIGQSII
jgi:hypothetical protein